MHVASLIGLAASRNSVYTGSMFGLIFVILLGDMVCAHHPHHHEVTITEDNFGEAIQPITNQVEQVRRFTLRNKHGVQVQVISYGATMTSIIVPDRNGVLADVLLGFDKIDGYSDPGDRAYFGATLGRVCNRIGHGTFTLNGVVYNVSRNENGRHTLHGGFIGFDRFIWNATIENNKVVMRHINPDMFQGFPGTVSASVTFSLNNENHLNVKYEATTSEPTPINLSNHDYFNLAGHQTGSAEFYKHLIQVNAEQITETDDELIPTGKLIDVAGTAFDLLTPKLVEDVIKNVSRAGLDDNYCVIQSGIKGALNLVGSVKHPGSGRSVEMFCDQPGVQVYTSNYLPDPENNIYPPGKLHLPQPLNGKTAVAGKAGARYFKHGAFCLETLKYPDAVNHPNFESTIVNPGETYSHHVQYRFSWK